MEPQWGRQGGEARRKQTEEELRARFVVAGELGCGY
jgi:hypothetical protein